MPPLNKAGFEKDPNYQKVDGAEARNLAANYGKDGAIVNKGDYWIVDGNVYRYTNEQIYPSPRLFSQVRHHPVTDWESYKPSQERAGNGDEDFFGE